MTRSKAALAALVLHTSACNRDEPHYEAGECLFLPRPPTRDLVAFERVFPAIAIEGGVDLLQGPADDRWYVVTQAGRIYSFPDRDDASAPELVADLSPQIVEGGEAGLLAMAFHPDFAENGEVFLSYTGPGGPVFTSRVSRFRSLDGGRTLDLASEEEILAVEQPYSNHNGGDIAFGPEGALYFGLGDGGSAGDPQGNAQDTSSLLGKILRVDVDGGVPYAIPPDNPFAAGGGRPEIFAWGLRNPWRFTFDRDTGALWAGDVGQNVWEEVDRVELGKNYGWNVQEGPDCFNRDTCDAAGLTPPVASYRNTGGASVIAGPTYRGAELPAIAGMFLYADFYRTTLWGVRAGEAPAVLGEGAPRGLSGFAEAADGEVLALDYQGGIYRLRAAPPGAGPALPDMLSQTGCIDVSEPRRAPADAVDYALNVPFWSDGADKSRWMFLPPGAAASVAADGDLALPTGSVVVKTFYLADAPVETRLMVRHDDASWAGYSYAWDGADATLLADAEQRELAGQTWQFPDRADCLYCHSQAAGYTLGLEAAQLERSVQDDAGASVDQLDHLVARGVLSSRPETTPLPELASDAPLAARARAYLHANCSQCHRPDAPSGRARIDLRATTPDAELGLCEAAPRAGDLGLAGAALLTPGDPARSILSARLHTLGSTRMPPLASGLVDPEGAALIDAWITSLVTCP